MTCKRLPMLFFLTCLISVLSLTANADAVDSYIQAEMQREHVPGLSIAVIKDSKIIKAKGYGYANIELKVPATPETVYQIGSVGKQFTSTLIMLLMEQGKLNLDDKISKYLSNIPVSWQDITIRQLLTHTAGIKEYTATYAGGPSAVNQRLDYTDEQLLNVMKSFPLDFKPGTQWSYSDTEYVLLGILIKKITGQFYGDLLQSEVFQPLGMKATRIISEEDIIPNRAAGYWLDKNQLKNQQYVSPTLNTTADGSIYSTVLDMAKWDAALNKRTILSDKDLAIMWTPVMVNGVSQKYGFGWEVTSINGRHIVWHSGWWQGFSSALVRDLDDKLTVIILCNLDKCNAPKIARRVTELYEPGLIDVSAKADKRGS